VLADEIILAKGRKIPSLARAATLSQRFRTRLAAIIAIALALAVRTPAQSAPAPGWQPGKVLGTVIDVNGDSVVGATVALTDTYPGDRRSVVTPDNGFFQFDNVQPTVQYLIIVSAEGFADWTSQAITLESGQVNLLGAVQLRIATARATVEVSGNSAEIATEQVKAEEKQRILGLIPNFYVAYDSDAEPLTAALKFRLALKVSVDPATIAGITVISAAKQAANTPAFGQGASGFGERFGATGADGFVDIMIGGAILPSVLHQDPRYFYKGTGTTKARLRHAILAPFVCKGDNGKWQPNLLQPRRGFGYRRHLQSLLPCIESRSGPGVLKLRDRHGGAHWRRGGSGISPGETYPSRWPHKLDRRSVYEALPDTPDGQVCATLAISSRGAGGNTFLQLARRKIVPLTGDTWM
jgi:hypothetical protein